MERRYVSMGKICEPSMQDPYVEQNSTSSKERNTGTKRPRNSKGARIQHIE
jgi:hypothetical protein